MLKIVCSILYMEWILPMPDFVTSFIDHLANTSALISHASKVMLKILHDNQCKWFIYTLPSVSHKMYETMHSHFFIFLTHTRTIYIISFFEKQDHTLSAECSFFNLPLEGGRKNQHIIFVKRQKTFSLFSSFVKFFLSNQHLAYQKDLLTVNQRIHTRTKKAKV